MDKNDWPSVLKNGRSRKRLSQRERLLSWQIRPEESNARENGWTRRALKHLRAPRGPRRSAELAEARKRREAPRRGGNGN